jgi:hypothetical protein
MTTRFVRFGSAQRRVLVSSVSICLVASVLLLSDSYSFGQTGQAVPSNASASPYGGWTCNDGYVKRGRTCVAIGNATDSEVRKLMIASSLAGYPGNCPCPYNTDRAGRSCGRRSAYSRPGGASPLCYDSDLTATAVKPFRARYPSKENSQNESE